MGPVARCIISKSIIVFNCTTSTVGGGLKNAALFIERAILCRDINWIFFVSRSVHNLLLKMGINATTNYYIFDSPAKSLSARRGIASTALKLNPDLVYTMAGPAYVQFKCFHVMGISNPYITHAHWIHFRFNRSLIKALTTVARAWYQSYCSKFADYFIFQTASSRDSYICRKRVPVERTSVISNAFDRIASYESEGCSSLGGVGVILVPGADYPHKAVNLLPDIISQLKVACELSNVKMPKFLFTLPRESATWGKIQDESRIFGVLDSIENIGPYSYSDLTDVMCRSDVLFVPSMLETFSASYLEAFFFGKPLVVAIADFSVDICGDAALYLDPRDPVKSAEVLFELICNQPLRLSLIEKGYERLTRYPSQIDRFNQIKMTLNAVLEGDALKAKL